MVKKMGLSAADIARAKRAVKAKFNVAKKKLVTAQRKAEGYVRKNPKKAVAIAAGAAALAAAITTYALMRRRK